MKATLVIILLLIYWATFEAKAQKSEVIGDVDSICTNYEINWIKQVSGKHLTTLTLESYDMISDKKGHIYITGGFTDTTVFDNIEKISKGSSDAYLTKYDTSGRVIWVKTLGSKFGDKGYGVTVDESGNVFVVGIFEDTIFFDSGYLNAAGYKDGFIAKYDKSGSFIWAKQIGGIGEDMISAVITDDLGNAYITGGFSRSAKFDNTVIGGYGQNDVFIAKYDPQGNIVWVKKAGGSGEDFGRDINIDHNRNLFLVGWFSNSAKFGLTTLEAEGINDIFVAKFNQEGKFQWTKRAGGDGIDRGRGLTVDGYGNCYLTGSFINKARFSDIQLVSKGGEDIFLTKINPGGDFIWAKSEGGFKYDGGRDLTLDNLGNIYLTGWYNGTFLNADSLKEKDVFISKYSNNGDVIWKKITGGEGNNFCRGIALDNENHFYVSGNFNGEINLGDTIINNSNSGDIFFAKISCNGVSETAPIADGNIKYTAYPNPTTYVIKIIANQEVDGLVLSILTPLGNVAKEYKIGKLKFGHILSFQLPTISTTYFLLKLQSPKGVEVKKILISERR